MAKLPKYDAVSIYELSTDTQRAIEALDEWDVGKSWVDLGKSWVDLSTGALTRIALSDIAIFFLLKDSPDDPELFPKGKWETLQRFEELIEKAISEAFYLGGEPHGD